MSLLEKTIKVNEDYNCIIVGVDFDDTVFPFNKEYEERCLLVRTELQKLTKNYNVIICLFSVADEQSLIYKSYIMEQWGLRPDYINESPVQKWGNCKKPYFNIYLDDKSGINEMIELLSDLNKNIEL